MNNKLKVSISGKTPDYFLKELMKKNINIYKIERFDQELRIIIDYNDYEKIKEMKTTYKIVIVKRYGLNKYLKLLRKYYILLFFFVIGIFINIILSNMIFKVQVVHPNKKVVKIILDDLEELGIKKYNFKVNYKKKELIKKKILLKEKNLLEWMEIEEVGTNYIIKVEERKKNNDHNKCYFRHIVAKKNALVLDIRASAGEIVKKKYDYVNKGDVLVSGLIHNKEEVVSKRCAIGVVFGEVWYNIKVIIPRKYSRKIITDNKVYGITFSFFGKEINLFNRYKSFEKEEYNIVNSKIIPFRISITRYLETRIDKVIVKNSDVDKKSLKIAIDKMKKRLKTNEEILDKKVLKKNEINSKIEVDIFLKTKENITDYQDITNIDVDEIDGNNKE